MRGNGEQCEKWNFSHARFVSARTWHKLEMRWRSAQEWRLVWKEPLITQSKGSFAKKFYVSHANLRQCANFAGYGRMWVLQMENSYRFFENKDCKYFPCHQGLTEFNCLFCYCPLYRLEHCPGNPRYFEKNGRRIKDCSDCTFPHDPEHYDTIMQILRET